MTKPEIIAKLAELGIEHDASASVKDLRALLPSESSEVDGDIKVADPQVLRPVDLPLVVEPTSGKWENAAQEEFAAIVNAYAYKNPAKFAVKKNDTTVQTANGPKVIPGLISQLRELATNPEKLALFKGLQDPANNKLSYTDKRITQ